MKHLHIKTFIGAAMLVLFLVACTKILDETPRAIYTPDYFKSEKGVNGGLVSMYAHLRSIYGNGYFYASTQSGTDEGTWGQNVNTDSKNSDFSGVGAFTASSTNNPAGAVWGVFPNINTASGIIENAAAVGTISPALVAEARFFRAFDYFLLVQTFGGVPLDLGAGELKFNTSASRTSVRNTVPQVYTKAIFPDLLTAINDLPDAPRLSGTATKTVARLFLAKAYLTYGWWLENPNGIPTYPESDRVDPDGHNAQWYFQAAYDIATAGIDNPGPYGLLTNYYDVNEGSNDRNKECMLWADHTQSSDLYNGAVVTGFAPGDVGGNLVNWFTTWNYTDLRSSGTGSVQREATQPNGRPWTAVAPTQEVIINAFADKINDSRYDGTFTTVYRGNWTKNPTDAGKKTLNNANGMPVSPGDPILSFLDSDPGGIVYPPKYPLPTGVVDISNIGAGIVAGRADYVIAPSAISRIVYPGLWKLGPYRTDNGTGLGQMNVTSTRPYVIAKFSELYLIAAEAAVKGATGTRSALTLINVLRARAGKWRWNNNGNIVKIQDNSAAMTSATPGTITIDYILDERTREFFGEGYRWYDLVRTQTWHTRAATYTICGTAKGDHTPVPVKRTIPLTAYLRPIPQSQFDGMQMTDEEKAAYQNPGY